MNEDTNTVDIEDEVSQADFEKEFFSDTSIQVEEDVVDEIEDTPLATEDDDEDEAEEQDEDDEDSEEEEEVEEIPQPKQKKNRAQERIEKLLERERLANERADALEKRLVALEAQKEVEQKEAPSLKEQLPAEAPSPDAKDENGEPLYELGEFDPKFIRDLTKFTIEQERAADKVRAEKEAQEAQVKAAQEELKNKWIDNVTKAEAELPDLREKLADMGQTFQGIDPNYGEYLASTIMSSDVGPEIMYYLSQNIDEAQKIVASGPVAATLALGRLEATLMKNSTERETKRNTKQVSKAPEPPEDIERARGRGGRFTVAPDTDDQRAFEREFFS
jgi:hypothetical protein